VLVPPPHDVTLAGVLALAVPPLALLGAIVPSFSAATRTACWCSWFPDSCTWARSNPQSTACWRSRSEPSPHWQCRFWFARRAHSLAIEAAARTLDLMAGSLPELFAGFVRPRDAAAIVRIQDNIGEAVRL
jgi:hypothetical protein